jgi:hypothetical protein
MKKKCNHPKEKRIIDIVAAAVGCETTRVKCTVCNKYLTEPKTDC